MIGRSAVATIATVGLCLARPVLLHGQATCITIFTNGPTYNRVNIVVLSEGYTTNELQQFIQDASHPVGELLFCQPYLQYCYYFNAFAIFVASAESGSDHPSRGIFKNTYFNSTYDSYGIPQLITIPPNDRDPNYANGRGKVDALLQALMPEYDLAILLVNDPEYGGSGGPILISSIHPDLPELVRHESGHTFAGLADEYDTPYPGYTPKEKPNATTQTNRHLIKWRAWILDTTPIPTPETELYADVVGLFEGAQYQPTGWYRPKLDCKMNHLNVRFCEVCSEQIVKSIYGLVRPIESFTPTSTNVTITSTQSVTFSVSTLQPMFHDLNVQWFTNGVAVIGETNRSYTLFPALLPNGTNTVRAEVRDLTPLVRNDPANLLSSSVVWTLNSSLTQLKLISPEWLDAGAFTFCVTGAAPRGFIIQSSTNLRDWISLSTNTLVGGKYNYTNFDTAGTPCQFYRAVACE